MRLFLALVIVIVSSLPASAHTTEGLDTWMDEWTLRAARRVTPSLLADLEGMRARHPAYFQPPTVLTLSASSSPPTATSPAPNRGMGSDVERWRPLVAAYFPAGQVDNALCVMRYESGGNPSAKNPRSSARGLFQILGSLWAPHYGVSLEALYDPDTNTRLAADIWGTYGWGAWSAWRKCR